MSLYVWNARISAAIFEVRHHVEVVLRNTIDAQFPPVSAADAPRGTWLEDPTILNGSSRKRVEETIARIVREGNKPTRGRVVAGLSFGFWRALFDRKYHRLWVSHLHRRSPAGSGDRAEVVALVSNLVPFRNRLAHHETILLRPIAGHYEEMLRLSALIDPRPERGSSASRASSSRCSNAPTPSERQRGASRSSRPRPPSSCSPSSATTPPTARGRCDA